MTPARFEPTISTDKQVQTYALDRAATGTGGKLRYLYEKLRQTAVRVVRVPAVI